MVSKSTWKGLVEDALGILAWARLQLKPISQMILLFNYSGEPKWFCHSLKLFNRFNTSAFGNAFKFMKIQWIFPDNIKTIYLSFLNYSIWLFCFWPLCCNCCLKFHVNYLENNKIYIQDDNEYGNFWANERTVVYAQPRMAFIAKHTAIALYR